MLHQYVIYIILMIFSYILASIPFGLIYVYLTTKQDIRTIGSKNIGCTNVYRASGLKGAIIVFILEFIKTNTMLAIAKFIFMFDTTYLLFIFYASILGHIFPIFLKFKGGKGIASMISGCLFISPYLFITTCIIWILIFKIVKKSFIAGIASTIVIFSSIIINHNDNMIYVFLSLFIPFLIIYRHKNNILNITKNSL